MYRRTKRYVIAWFSSSFGVCRVRDGFSLSYVWKLVHIIVEYSVQHKGEICIYVIVYACTVFVLLLG